jgi:hypothetical protein
MTGRASDGSDSYSYMHVECGCMYTPRCPSVVLWTPCSGVEWRVFEPTIRFGEAVGAQAACEPGGGGRGAVPVHPARLHSHRTSPAQALLTIWIETCGNV